MKLKSLDRNVCALTTLLQFEVSAMPSRDWVTVCTVSKPFEAEVIKSALEAKGIKCFLDGAGQAAHVGIGLFEIKIQVSRKDAERALELIESHEPLESGESTNGIE
jgi:Putative prokaryotic signal transducing protein